tara:strand:+ start:420 stop:668 length:249 start_codon:yes stop_codon:yes gene_type:complete
MQQEEVHAHVKWFNNVKGFGFLTGDDGFEYFLHYSCVCPDDSFELDARGRPYIQLMAMQEVMIVRWVEEDKGRKAREVVKLP